MGLIFGNQEVITNNLDDDCHCHDHEGKSCHCEHQHYHKSIKNNILEIFRHTAYDMFEVVKYLMFGALIASLV